MDAKKVVGGVLVAGGLGYWLYSWNTCRALGCVADWPFLVGVVACLVVGAFLLLRKEEENRYDDDSEDVPQSESTNGKKVK